MVFHGKPKAMFWRVWKTPSPGGLPLNNPVLITGRSRDAKMPRLPLGHLRFIAVAWMLISGSATF
jgi:hypothetical protein